MWLLIVVLSLALILFYRRRVRQMSVLRRNGIPGPKPHFIFGNLFEMRSLSPIERQKAWIEKYGKIVGCYSGAKPIVLVADPELAKNIQIKDFQYFTDRPHFALRFMYPSPRHDGSLIRSCGKRWKQMRSVLTPAFSASKLKTMTAIIDDSINTFLHIIDTNSKSGEEFNIYELYQRLTTDVIARTAFGVKSDVQTDGNNEFLRAFRQLLETKVNKFVYLLVNCFPELDYLVYPLRRLDETLKYRLGFSHMWVLMDMSSDIIKLRKENPSLRRNDLLQVMLDLKVTAGDVSDDKLIATYDENENLLTSGQQNGSKPLKNSLRLTEDEIKANCVLFYGAGYETTSTTLGFVAHILVNYPEVQERIRQEVRHLYKSEGKLDFNTVNKLEYMEWVLNETMRIYPPIVTFVTRECLADYPYNGMTLPKGAVVAMATHYLHHDENYWPDPEKFDPERFSPERRHQIHPSSWQPFGSGPRNCVGMRFAFFEMKLSLAKLLLNYRLERGCRTEIGELTTACKLISLSPKYGIYVKAVKI